MTLHEEMFSGIRDTISEDAVAINTVLHSVAANNSLYKLLTNKRLSTGEIVTILRDDILPLLAAQNSLLHKSSALCVLHNASSVPDISDTLQESALCSADGLELLRAMRTYDDTGMRAQFLPDDKLLKLYQPMYSRQTLQLIGVVCADINLDSMLGSMAELEFPTCAFSEDGAVVWENTRLTREDSAELWKTPHEGSALIGGVRHYIYHLSCPSLLCSLCFAVPESMVLQGKVPFTLYIGGAVLLLAAMVAIGVGIYVPFLRQLRGLIASMERVAQGDSEARIAITGDNELTAVARTCNNMLDEARQLLARVVESGKLERAAVYAALSNQLKPHFINNALDRTRMQAIRTGNVALADTLASIMRYISYNLGKQDVAVTLTDELSSISSYIDMVNLSKDTDILLEIMPRGRMYGNLDEYYLPKFTLQPIVENCVHHGFVVRAETQRRIMVTLECDGNYVYYQIEDNGVGMKPEHLAALKKSLESSEDKPYEPSMGIGLNLIRRRLELYYSRKISFTIDSYEDFGTLVTIAVPDVKNEAES